VGKCSVDKQDLLGRGMGRAVRVKATSFRMEGRAEGGKKDLLKVKENQVTCLEGYRVGPFSSHKWTQAAKGRFPAICKRR